MNAIGSNRTWRFRRAAQAGILASAVLCRAAEAQVVQRSLGPIEARSEVLFGDVVAIRPLPNGALLLLDAAMHRISLLDATLTYRRTVADTSVISTYRSAIDQMMPWLGDSTLLISPATFSMFLIDAEGRRGRSMSLPRVGVADCFVAGRVHMPMLDVRGRAICRLPPDKSAGRVVMVPEAIPLADIADSAMLIRYDVASRRSDSVTYLRTAKTEMTYERNEACVGFVMPAINPVPVVDEWTVTSDGLLVIVRGRTFDVEWLDQDGTRRQSAHADANRLHLTMQDKLGQIDSLKATLGRRRNATLPRTIASGGAPNCGRVTTIDVLPTDAAENPRLLASRGYRPPLPFVRPALVADTTPFFSPGGVQADADGDVWIRSFGTQAGNATYRIFDARGVEAGKLTLSGGGEIVGFGANHAVYLVEPEGVGFRLERARWK